MWEVALTPLTTELMGRLVITTGSSEEVQEVDCWAKLSLKDLSLQAWDNCGLCGDEAYKKWRYTIGV